MLDFSRRLTRPSLISYAAWRARGQRKPVILELRSGTRFELRPNSHGNNDLGVAYEVFVLDYYNDGQRLDREKVRLVVDLGANVGFSVLYWMQQFPHCRVIAFEPHPAHVAQAERNLLLDGHRDRVELHANAAGAAARRLRLSDAGSSSSLVGAESARLHAIDVVDVFATLLGKRIDLLKIDIEGGEYEILGDPRCAELTVDAIVMEWHQRGTPVEDKRWCGQRLAALGFKIDEIFSAPGHGMLWAVRNAGQDRISAGGLAASASDDRHPENRPDESER